MLALNEPKKETLINQSSCSSGYHSYRSVQYVHETALTKDTCKETTRRKSVFAGIPL
jgi:hypothetical protein